MLPKFLIADNSQVAPDTIYVVHNESPRYIVESDIEDFWSNQEVHWIDQKPATQEEIRELMQEAEDFLEAEFENQENFEFDDEDED